MMLVFVVLMVEAGLATDVFLNRDWEEVNILHSKAFTRRLSPMQLAANRYLYL